MSYPSSFLYVTFSGRYSQGFRVFNLDLYNSQGRRVDRVAVLSGSAATQWSPFISPEDDFSGSGRCLPEGIYDLGVLEDRGAGKSWGEGIGRYWVSVDTRHPVNDRSAFGIHDDANRQYSKGSAGCLCPFSAQQMERIVGWFKQQSRPEFLICNLGMGWLQEQGIAFPGAVRVEVDGGFALGANFVKAKESCVLEAYPDPGTGAQPWTIGWGNTLWQDGRAVAPGDRLESVSEADQLFDFWAKDTWNYLRGAVPGWERMSAGQRAALFSLSYNTGWRIKDGRHKTLDSAILAQNWHDVPKAFRLYINRGTPVEHGLRLRREEEIRLWMS